MNSSRPTSETPSASGGLVAKLRLGLLRAWLRKNRKPALAAFGGLTCIVLSLATLYYFLAPHPASEQHPPTLAAAVALLDAGQYEGAREAAEQIQAAGNLQEDAWGGPPYVIGAASLYEADETIDPGDRAQRFLVASRFLERSYERGFPAGRQTEGLLLYARSLHESGRYAQAIEISTKLLAESPALRPTALRMLASCYLRSDPPQLDQALGNIEAVLATPDLAPADREAAILLYGETLLAKRDFSRCAELVAQIPEASPLYPQAMLLKGRSLLETATALAESGSLPTDPASRPLMYAQAVDALRAAHARRATDHRVTREAAYLIGVALRRSGSLVAAQAHFLRVRKSHFESPEGIAAALEEAELAAELGQSEAALAGYLNTLEQVRAAPSLVNPWITEKQLAKRLEAGYGKLLSDHRYPLAVALASSLAPPLEQVRIIEMVAGAHEKWGEHLQHLAVNDVTAAGVARRSAARQQFRAAGDAYARLAELHVATRRYSDDLWKAGRNYAAGHDFGLAVELYREYLHHESKRERPAVLVKLGESLLSLDRADDALAALNECMATFPKDPAAYNARLLASRALIEKDDIAQAKLLLQTNLHHESLTPRSDVWRDSLFAMGTLLHDQGQAMLMQHNLGAKHLASTTAAAPTIEAAHDVLRESLRYLAEAVERYPNDPQATLARFQIAEAHRQAAKLPLTLLQTESIESRRAILSAQAQQELKDALAAYDELTASLNRRADEVPLMPVEQSILRNAYFARGGVLYDLGDFEKAIQAYSTATNRYQNEPSAVEAYVQIASCYRRLNKPLEARGTLEQAKLVIERMPPDADFTKTTRFARDEWNTLLDWLSGT